MSPELSKTRMSVFYRAYEPEVTNWLQSVIRPGTVFYDIGAHIGIHTLYVAKLLLGDGHVYAFEPWPNNYQQLCRHLSINGLAHLVTAVPVAVSDRAGESPMLGGKTDGTHRLATLERSAPVVHTTTLDAYVQTTQPPDVMKIDVEGSELEVLKGGREMLERHRPKVILEHHGDARRDRGAELLQSFGYSVEACGRRHIVTL